MSAPAAPVLGPCTSWIDGEYLAESGCCDDLTGSAATPALLDYVAVQASMVMYELSGGRYNGVCDSGPRRPCRTNNDCWGRLPLGSSGSGYYWSGGPIPWAWRSEEFGPHCGCAPTEEVKLAGYPVREITEVKIDGSVLDELDGNGNPNWRLDGRDTLTRMDDPGPPVVKRRWPSCQNMALNDTEPGTFSVRYTWGIDPPPIGQQAAAELACQLLQACPGGDAARCRLPKGATKVTRQGVTIDRKLLQGFLQRNEPTGLVSIDLFIASYVPIVGARPPAVWWAGMREYARRVGT